MQKKKNLGSVRRFGSRYGRTIRAKIANIESLQRKKHTCPYCAFPNVRRRFFGVWECTKCDSVFSGKAYSPAEKKRAVVETAEISAEITAEGTE